MNRSEYLTSVSGKNVFMGFIHVQGLEEQFMKSIIENRKHSGPFIHLSDLMERLAPGIEQLNILIRIGAFRFCGKTKRQVWHDAMSSLQIEAQKDGWTEIVTTWRDDPMTSEKSDLPIEARDRKYGAILYLFLFLLLFSAFVLLWALV